MKNLSKTHPTILTVLISLAVTFFFIAGCEKESTPGPEKKPVPTAPAKSQFVNTRCPIMGTPIDPNKVPPGLIREFKGQKVAFCCGDCPAKWDKLSDKEKEAKLREAASKK